VRARARALFSTFISDHKNPPGRCNIRVISAKYRAGRARRRRIGEVGEGGREIEYSIPATMTDKIGASTLARNVFIFETSTELILKV